MDKMHYYSATGGTEVLTSDTEWMSLGNITEMKAVATSDHSAYDATDRICPEEATPQTERRFVAAQAWVCGVGGMGRDR